MSIVPIAMETAKAEPDGMVCIFVPERTPENFTELVKFADLY